MVSGESIMNCSSMNAEAKQLARLLSLPRDRATHRTVGRLFQADDVVDFDDYISGLFRATC